MFGMTKERYNELMAKDSTAELTVSEWANGWHWCPDFDGLLLTPLDPDHPEWTEGCLCEGLRRERPEYGG